jgi:hypothetical protein
MVKAVAEPGGWPRSRIGGRTIAGKFESGIFERVFAVIGNSEFEYTFAVAHIGGAVIIEPEAIVE